MFSLGFYELCLSPRVAKGYSEKKMNTFVSTVIFLVIDIITSIQLMNDTTNAHRLSIWNFDTSTIYSWLSCLFKHQDAFLRKKSFKERETAFKDIMTPKFVEIYRTGICNDVRYAYMSTDHIYKNNKFLF